ncbi:MAG: ACP S-malonyltransferase [Alistipes sp.]|nr:ACP S-malonyltransferase [Alistipes sp.]
MKAYVFPGQGAQCVGMGKDLYEKSDTARAMFERANDILGFRITDIMFSGTAEELRRTDVTQPAVFLHSAILATVLDIEPDAVAGHSLGEFSALVACGALNFEDALVLVSKRAQAMQRAAESNPGTMSAVINLDNTTIETICAQTEGVVVAANYNCPGQVVISGEVNAVSAASEALKAAGARRCLPLAVGGAFHSPLMAEAEASLAQAIAQTEFSSPRCPIYQNVDAQPHTDPQIIKSNLIAQLTQPVRWAQSVQRMTSDGVQSFTEVGTGTVLQGLIRKISAEVDVLSVSTI